MRARKKGREKGGREKHRWKEKASERDYKSKLVILKSRHASDVL